MFFFLLFSQRPWNIESHIHVVKPMPSPQQTEQNAARFNASLKEKLEKLNMSNRPLPNVPSKSQPTLQFHFPSLLFPRNWLCKKRTSELQCKFSPNYFKCLEQESSTIVKMCSTPSENRRQLPWKRFKVQRQRHSTEWLNFSTAIGSIKKRWTRQTIRVSEAAVRARRQSIVAWVVNVWLSKP